MTRADIVCAGAMILVGALLATVLHGVRQVHAQDKAPDLTDAEIVRIVRRVHESEKARQAFEKERTEVIAKVNSLPEVKAMAAHQKAILDADQKIVDDILKSHSLDPKKWTLDFQGQRIVPIQQAQPPAPPQIKK